MPPRTLLYQESISSTNNNNAYDEDKLPSHIELSSGFCSNRGGKNKVIELH